MPERPIQHCYWVKPGHFLAGEYPRTLDGEQSRHKLRALLKAGVTCFIDLTEENEWTRSTLLLPYSPLLDELAGEAVEYHRIPIPDQSVPRDRNVMRRILDLIDARIERGHMIYLHCWGGVGRTGTVVGCWLARHGHEREYALVRLTELWSECPKSRWRESPENQIQRNFVIGWRAHDSVAA